MIQIKITGGGMPHHAMDRTQWAERDKSRPYAIRDMPAGSSYAGLVEL